MMIRRVAVLCLAFALAGCTGDPAGDDGAGTPPSGAPSGSVAPSLPTEDPSPVRPSVKPPDDIPPPDKPKPGPRQTLTGKVVAGVEANCRMLRGPDREYQLIMGNRVSPPKVGSTVTVVGIAEPDMVTTCMQGVPFVVSEIRPG